MADIVDIETRRISGTGIIRIPEDMRKLRRYYLYADIIRRPFQRSISREFEPERSYYARINFMSKGYVVQEYVLNYDAQMWEIVPDVEGQSLIAVKCAYAGTLETFENLGVAAGYPPFVTENLTVEMLTMEILIDQINVKMYADTAFQFALKGRPYSYCGDENPPSEPPPDPPEKPEPVDPQVPTEISPPYEEDDDITNPAPIDDDYVPPDPDPIGEACERYRIQITLTVLGSTFNAEGFCWGLFSPTVSVDPSNNTYVVMPCQGGQAESCQSEIGSYRIYSAGSPITSVTYVGNIPV